MNRGCLNSTAFRATRAGSGGGRLRIGVRLIAVLKGFGALAVTRREFADGVHLFTTACELSRDLALFPDLGGALAYWNGKQGTREIPRRDDLYPGEMVEFLPRVMLADVERDPLRFRYCLCGTGICHVHPFDPTHLAADELHPPTCGELVHAQYLEVLQSRQSALHLNVFDNDDRHRSYAHLILPLSRDRDAVDMIMTVDSQAQDQAKMMQLLVELQRGAGIGLGDFYLLPPNRTT